MRKLSKQLVDQIAQVTSMMGNLDSELGGAMETASAYADERSDAWQDSDSAETYRAWIENMEEGLDALRTAIEALGEISAAPK